MNKKILYWSVGSIVVVIIIIVVLSSGKSTSSLSTSSTSRESGQTTAVTARQTMHDLISSGATEICSFSIAATATTSSLSGTIYMEQGRMRGDLVRTDTAGKITTSHITISSSTVFLWSDATSKGYKLLWSIAASSSAMLGKAGGIDVNQVTDYSCANKTPTPTEFVLPTNIIFTDITSLIKNRSL